MGGSEKTTDKALGGEPRRFQQSSQAGRRSEWSRRGGEKPGRYLDQGIYFWQRLDPCRRRWAEMHSGWWTGGGKVVSGRRAAADSRDSRCAQDARKEIRKGDLTGIGRHNHARLGRHPKAQGTWHKAQGKKDKRHKQGKKGKADPRDLTGLGNVSGQGRRLQTPMGFGGGRSVTGGSLGLSLAIQWRTWRTLESDQHDYLGTWALKGTCSVLSDCPVVVGVELVMARANGG